MSSIEHLLYPIVGFPKNQGSLEPDVKSQDQDKLLGSSNTKTNSYDLLKLSWNILPDKAIFIMSILIIQFVSSLSSIGLLTHNKWLIILTPILKTVLGVFQGIYNDKLMYKFHKHWLTISLDYFNDLSWTKKHTQEDMTDFHRMIHSASGTLFSLVSWGIPSIANGIRSLVVVIYILKTKGYVNLIFVTAIIYYLYFQFIMKKRQDNLTNIRIKMRDLNKIIVSKRKWLLQLFKSNKRNTEDIINLDVVLDSLDQEYYFGWSIINNGMGLTSCIISFIGLMGISDWDNFLLVKIVFDELRNTIDMFSHFSTNFVSKAKDFDKYLTWYEESGGRELDVQYYDLPKSGLNFDSVNINLDNKFLLEAHGLNIKPNDFILLRGKTGIGKTQLVNCLQGYTPGATLSNTKFQPKNYSKNWEYLNQNMRETIPTNGLSLREMLENESDTDLIMELIRVVKLDDKIILNSDINEKMQGYSGGQRMKTSLVFTLLEVIKNRKSILVLDEPEQGLDPFSRLDVIQSVLEFCKTGIKKYIGSINLSVLVIYHGDDTDIIKMNKLFNKIWLFDKKLNKSHVIQTLNIKEFCTDILKNKQQELDKLSIEIK